MLSHRFQTIFIHVPKTAGRSIATVFLERHGLTWKTRGELLLRANKDRQRGPERLAHLYAREYVECGHVSDETFARYFKFAVVRDPYARAISAYRYRVPDGTRPLAAFLRELPDDDREDRARHLAPQVNFVSDRSGRVLPDCILRYENLQQEIGGVFERIFGMPLPLSHANSSPLPFPPLKLSDEDADLIYRRFEADFDFFRYARRRK
jgi:hypothetical protein